MKVWLACFLLLFALAELFQWAQQFSFPLPIYILGGAFLAIASNYDKLGGLRWLTHDQSLINSTSQPAIGNSTSQPLQPISFAAHHSEQMHPCSKDSK